MDFLTMKEHFEIKNNYEKILKGFLQNHTEAIWLKNKNLELITANKTFYELFTSLHNSDLIKAEKEILETNEQKTFTLTSDKKKQVLSITAIPIFSNEDLDYILFISQNITELAELKERFFVNKYQLSALLENIPKIIYMKDLNGNYITGTKYSADFLNKGYDFFHNITLNLDSIETSRIVEDKSVIQNNKLISYETDIIDKTGIPHWYTIYKAPILDYNKHAIGIIVMAKNIDNEKLIQVQKESFVASLGHDLKNPTIAQIRALELLLKGEFGKFSEEQTEILKMVLDSCKYMNAMLSSLLATYKNEKGIVKLNYEKFSLSELSEDCLSEMIYLAKDKNIELHLNKNNNITDIFGDNVQIRRVIMNLLSNSIKYAVKNSNIYINLYIEDDFTCFSIENNSPYIPEEKRDSIFAQYVTFAEAHNEFGIGIGLYASKKIIEAHNGQIFVDSFIDNRNIFGFKLPNDIQEALTNRSVSF